VLSRDKTVGNALTLHPTPYTLHPTPYTLHPTPPLRPHQVGNAVAAAHVAAAKQAAAKATPAPRPSSPRSRQTIEQQQAAVLINSKNAVSKAEEAVSSRFRNMHQAPRPQ
jgi:hypothetical protein